MAPNGLSASFWRVSRPTSEQQTQIHRTLTYSREANRMSFSENVTDSEPIIHLRFRLDLALPLPSLSCLALNPGCRWIWCRGYYSAIPRDDRMKMCHQSQSEHTDNMHPYIQLFQSAHNTIKSPVRMWSLSRAQHFSIPASFPRSVISIENPHLLASLISRTESVASLLSHSLHLPHLSHSLLKLFHSGPVVLDIVLLNFLHMVICLWIIHSFGVFPCKVAGEAYWRQQEDHGIEHGG